jgi:hypothetical protein
VPEGFPGIDMDDPTQHFAWAIGAMPSHQAGGMPVPIPPKIVPDWSKFLYDLGFRHHPEEQTLFPITGEQTHMAWLMPVRFVSREEYDKHVAAREGKLADLAAAAEAMNPGLAEQVAAMSDPERRAAMAAEGAKLGRLFEQMQNMQKGNTDAQS